MKLVVIVVVWLVVSLVVSVVDGVVISQLSKVPSTYEFTAALSKPTVVVHADADASFRKRVNDTATDN